MLLLNFLGDEGASEALGRGGDLLEDLRAWDRVAGRVAVEVEDDAVLLGSVQLLAVAAVGTVVAGPGVTRAGELDVEAHGVVLGTALRAGRVQSDDLVAQDEVARGDVGRDRVSPGEVVAYSSVVSEMFLKSSRISNLLISLSAAQVLLLGSMRPVSSILNQSRDDASSN